MRPATIPALVWALLAGPAAHGGNAPAVVCNVKVVSDKVDDVSSLEAWRDAVIKPAMTEKEKALAAWEAVVKFRHHDMDAREYAGLSNDICMDAVRLFNSYGYCSGRGAHIAMKQLTRFLGLKTQAMSVNAWGTTEVFYDNAWHCLDPGMIFYFRKADGKIASVADFSAGLGPFYDEHPGMSGDVNKIKQFLATEGFARGPAILRDCPTMDARGNFPLNYFGWYSAMYIFDPKKRKPFVWEEPYTQGHRVNIRLHPGESLTRSWSNAGNHANKDGGRDPESLKAEVGKGVLYYTPKYGDIANGRIGMGRTEYAVGLAGSLAGAAISMENLAVLRGVLCPKDAKKPGVLVLGRQSGYVYLGGAADIKSTGKVTVEVSDTNGLHWKQAAELDGPGRADLTPHILRRYDYRLRLTVAPGAAVEGLSISEETQCSQRALPTLGQGANRIAFSAGPHEGTVTIEGAGPKFKGKQPTFDELGATVQGMNPDSMTKWGTWSPAGGEATVTFPVETPGDMTRIRIGCNYRANNADEGWEMEVSLDGGGTWKLAGRATGPARFGWASATFTEIPKGTRKALVRFRGTQRAALVIFDKRIDADYAESAGGFAPVKITYEWEEGGQAKSHVHVAKSSSESFTITCGAKPRMKSVTLELAE